jgi:Flp pilus assembly protein TadG
MSMRRQHEKRPGAVLVFVAIVFVALIGVIAVTVDFGNLLADKRHVQAAADAAALAAAIDLFHNYSANAGTDPKGTAAANAKEIAKGNGYTSDSGSVTVNIPPKSGNFVGKSGYAEVIITFNQKRFFSSALGTGSLEVKGRAVARTEFVALGASLVILGRGTQTMKGTLTKGSKKVTQLSSTSNLAVGESLTGKGISAGATIASIIDGTSITLSSAATAAGSNSLTITESSVAGPNTLAQAISTNSSNNNVLAAGKIIIDSNNSDAADIGNAHSWLASRAGIDIVGQAGGNGSTNLYAPVSSSWTAPTGDSTKDLTTAVNTNKSSLFVADPLDPANPSVVSDYPPVPSQPASPTFGSTGKPYTPTANEQLKAGYYPGGISISNSGVTMAGGLYYLGGDFTVNGVNATVNDNGNGVLIYLSGSSTFNMLGGGNATLSPAGSYTYSGGVYSNTKYQLTIFQDRSATLNNAWSVKGGSTTTVQGLIYAPRASLTFTGSASAAVGQTLLVNQVSVTGTASLILSQSLVPVGTQGDVRLVE